MKILITGANGFIGKNLICHLFEPKFNHIEVIKFDKENTIDELKPILSSIDLVFHLAGVNRDKDDSEFMRGNFGLTSELINALEEVNNPCPILITSSIHADKDNVYGVSKKAGEELIFDYGKRNNVDVFVYRLPNVFGKWCRPNYNSAVATFCHNIARGLEITVNDPNVDMQLVYIDDVIEEFINIITSRKANKEGQYCVIPITHEVKLGYIVRLIESFKNEQNDLLLPNVKEGFEKKLYSTYLSYLEKDKFSYKVKMNIDNRGSFTELIKTNDRGQVSVNVTLPGITKGNHYHHSKIEKFIVVAGEAKISFRKIDETESFDYFVSEKNIEIVNIPCGYTHNITNIGSSNLVTIMWCNELFNENKPDTYFMEVSKDE